MEVIFKEIKDFLITNKSNDTAGHSNPDEKYHLDEELKDIISNEWNDEIHVIKSVSIDKITNNIQEEIESMFNSVFNLFIESSSQNSVSVSQENGFENYSEEDARKELFIDKATLLISVSFNLISNSSAVSTIISESTDHAFPRASGF